MAGELAEPTSHGQRAVTLSVDGNSQLQFISFSISVYVTVMLLSVPLFAQHACCVLVAVVCVPVLLCTLFL